MPRKLLDPEAADNLPLLTADVPLVEGFTNTQVFRARPDVYTALEPNWVPRLSWLATRLRQLENEHYTIASRGRAPRRWACFEVREQWSKLLLPGILGVSADHAARLIVEQVLPAAFHEADVILRWTGTMRPDAIWLSCQLWFWLDRPATGPELAAWLAQKRPAGHCKNWTSPTALIAPATLQPDALIATAAPLWLDAQRRPLPDPIPMRTHLIRRQHREVHVPEPIVLPEPVAFPQPGAGDDWLVRAKKRLTER